MTAPPPGHLAVVVNGSGGRASREGDALGRRIRDAFAKHACTVVPRIVAGARVAEELAAASGADCVAVGGGDGTLGHAAGQLAESGQAMAVLPLGTLNHLSLDLGIPADLTLAADVAVNGLRETIDLGEVNGTVFVNNASIGLYARMVRDRDARRLPKWLATIPAAWTVLGAFKLRQIVIEVEGQRRTIATPLLFIGNNRYEISGAQRGKRVSLRDGLLSVYAVRPRSAAGLIGFALRALIGRADPMRDFLGIAEVRELTVLGEGTIPVAHDGEVTSMALPLRFRLRPAALTVMVPAP
ncbi:diacylglycerol/lipid kinase family protein [Novosphingobium aquiterrae]|uniref:Diacylglycerol/lipid kinase family protein n=1 Tax=Novosphingobium aquiterrae TaxID=624388 RepID=A0ABV6PE11_9SPHN